MCGDVVPGLSNIPILGSLFENEEKIHKRAELVAVILTFSASPASAGIWDSAPLKANRDLGHASESKPAAQATAVTEASADEASTRPFIEPSLLLMGPGFSR